MRQLTLRGFGPIVSAIAVVVMSHQSAVAELPEPGDLVFGHSDFDAPETLGLVRGPAVAEGGVSVADPWDAVVPSIDPNIIPPDSSPIQSVEFDNFGGIPHNARGNLLGVNFGSSTTGGEIYSLATTVDPAPTPQSIGHTQDLDFGPTRLGGLSVSPDNTKIAVSGYDSRRLIVFDYTAGDTMGVGATLTNGRESGAFFEPTDTQGTAWLDNNTVLAFHSLGDLYEIDATTMAHTLVKDLDSPILGGEVTALAYNPAVSPYVYAAKSSFVNPTTTNTLFILDPNDNYNLVKQLNLSTSLSNTAREMALDADGNLFISSAFGNVDFIPNADDPMALTDDSPIFWFESDISSLFNGIDIGFGEEAELEGDYNGDGSVDAADYVVWRKNNINGQQGYDDWRTNFGLTTGPGSANGLSAGAAVPEPISACLMVVGLIGFGLASRRSAQQRVPA
ncbi:MAG TPA: hypothetical protein VGK58_17690 [Lacipirellulaceae bacterium]